MRDYLQRLYGVGVLRIRSYVEQQKVTRLRPLGKFGYGRLRRPMSKKKMTVEMKEPFVWPEPPKDMSPYSHPLHLFVEFWRRGCVLMCFGTDGRRTSTSRPRSTRRKSNARNDPRLPMSPTRPSARNTQRRRRSCWPARRPGDRLGRRWDSTMTGRYSEQAKIRLRQVHRCLLFPSASFVLGMEKRKLGSFLWPFSFQDPFHLYMSTNLVPYVEISSDYKYDIQECLVLLWKAPI